MCNINLYCFPYAGGNRYSYNDFVPFASKHLHLVQLETMGRGSRMREKCPTDITEIALDLFKVIAEDLKHPYAFYGHSMGTILAYLVLLETRRNNIEPPACLFVSGRGGPSMKNNSMEKSKLPYNQFLNEIKKIGGTSDEVLNNREIMSVYEPILRSDFKALESFQYQDNQPFNMPILIMIGNEEKITNEDINLWQLETNKKIEVQRFPGGHFFISKYPKEIMYLINKQLKGLMINNIL